MRRALCSGCAENTERIALGDSGISLTELVGIAAHQLYACDNKITVCPTCGNTVNDVIEAGIVGCSDCYTVFHDEVEKMIDEMQGRRRNSSHP